VTYAICLLVVLALIWDDRKQGGIRAPYPILGGALLLQDLGFLIMS